jgi:hypothetical protein
MIMIMLQDFMDPWTFNQKNLMNLRRNFGSGLFPDRCKQPFAVPGFHRIPSRGLRNVRLVADLIIKKELQVDCSQYSWFHLFQPSGHDWTARRGSAFRFVQDASEPRLPWRA